MYKPPHHYHHHLLLPLLHHRRHRRRRRQCRPGSQTAIRASEETQRARWAKNGRRRCAESAALHLPQLTLAGTSCEGKCKEKQKSYSIEGDERVESKRFTGFGSAPLYNEVQEQLVRAASRLRSSGSAAKALRYFMKAPPGPFVSPLTVPGTPPSPPGSPVLSQPPYSRGGDPRQRWSPLGFRTEWGWEGRRSREVARLILPPLSREATNGQPPSYVVHPFPLMC